MLKYCVLGAAAAGFAFLLTPWVASLAVRLGAVDEPNERRVHAGAIPSLGGLAVFAAFLGALVVGLVVDQLAFDVFWGQWSPWVWLLAGALVVAACGTADDIWTLGPVPKLGFQVVAGGMVLAAGHGIAAVTNPVTGGSVYLGWWGVPLTLLWVVGITNAFNLIDGLDGLAAGVALIASGTLFVISLAGGHVEVALLAATLAGALAGFLWHNFHPAKVFLGDSGALVLGYLLAVFSIQASQKGATAVVILVPILALGLPIMDTLLAMVRRLLGALHVVHWDSERNEYRFLVLGSASIFRADREHIHHRLLRMGLTHRRAVLVLYAVCGALGAMAFLAVRAKGANIALLVAVVACASYVGIRKLAYQEVKLLSRGTLLPLFELPVLNRRAFHALVDCGFVALAYAVALLLAGGGHLDAGARTQVVNALIVVTGAKLAVFVYSGVYERAYRYTNAGDLLALAKALVAAQAVAAAAVAALSGLPRHAAVLLVVDFYLCATLVVGARVSFKVLELLARGQGEVQARRALIYGAGSRGTAVLREISENPSLGYCAVGFIDDMPSLWGVRVNDVPVLGGVGRLGELIDQHDIHEVIIATPKIPPERVDAVATACRAGGVELRRFRITLEEVDVSPVSLADAPSSLRRAAEG